MRRQIAALALFALASACGGDSTPTNPVVGIAGTFNLVTVNGAPLPYIGTNDTEFKYEVVSDTYVLSESRTWTEVFTYRFTDKMADTVSVTELRDAGSFTQTGTSIRLLSQETDMSGEFDGSALRFVLNGGFELIYKR
jgi:hypothetical protein